MSAIRTARAAEGKFVQLTNAAGQDRRLSLQARGLIYFLLSLPQDRKFTLAWVETQVPNGRESVRAAWKNLQECGYARRDRYKDALGHWVWDQLISDAPVENPSTDDGNPVDGNPSDGATSEDSPSSQVSPSDGFPSDGSPSDKELNTGTTNTINTSAAERPSNSAAAEITNDDLTEIVIQEIKTKTGRTVDPTFALLVASDILSGANSRVAHPDLYVQTAIRDEANPARFMPTHTPPKAGRICHRCCKTGHPAAECPTLETPCLPTVSLAAAS